MVLLLPLPAGENAGHMLLAPPPGKWRIFLKSNLTPRDIVRMPTWAMDMPPVEGESSTIPFQILRV